MNNWLSASLLGTVLASAASALAIRNERVTREAPGKPLRVVAAGLLLALQINLAIVADEDQPEMQDTKEADYQTILAPVSPWDEGAPAINGPSVYGASPGKDSL